MKIHFAYKIGLFWLVWLIFTIVFVPLQAIQASSSLQTNDAATQCAEGVRLYQSGGKVDQALPLLEAGFANRANATFADPDVEGQCALALGIIRSDTAHLADALAAYEVALAVFQSTKNRLFEGMTLHNIGWVYRNQKERYNEALDTLQKALNIFTELEDRAWQGSTLTNIGWTHQALGEYDDALATFKQSLDIFQELKDQAGQSEALYNIGTVYRDQGKYSEAKEYFEQALDKIPQDASKLKKGNILADLALVCTYLGCYAEAAQYYQQATEIMDELGGPVPEAANLNTLGGFLLRQGKLAEALETYKKALDAYRNIPDRAMEGVTLNNIGEALRKQGRYAEALDAFQQALMIHQEVKDQAMEGTTLANLGAVFYNQGRYDEALERYQQALTIFQDLNNQAQQGVILNNIGLVYDAQEKDDEALAYYNKALPILRQHSNRIIEGVVLSNIGLIYQTQEQYEQAAEYFQGALKIQNEVDRAGAGLTLNNMGLMYQDQKRYPEALDHYQKALSTAQEVGDRANEGVILGNIGVVYEAQGKTAEALDSYQKALDILDTVRVTAGSEEGRASFIAQYSGLYDHAISLLHRQGQDDDTFLISERGRARSFLDSLATGQVQLNDDIGELLSREQETYIQLQVARTALANAKAASPPDPKLIADLENALKEAEQKYTTAQTAIIARRDQLADLIPGRKDNTLAVKQVQSWLDSQTTLVSYFILEDQTLAFVLTTNTFEVIELDFSTDQVTNREGLINLVRDFRDLIDQNHPGAISNAQKLYQRLITPLTNHLSTPKLIIVPNGVLNYLPFTALQNEASGQYLIEQYQLISLPSASVLPFITPDRQSSPQGQSEWFALSPYLPALVLGNPTTGDPNDALALAVTGDGFSDLPAAEKEAQAVAALYGVTPLLAQAATEQAVYTQAPRASIVHLASHGIYKPATPLNSYLALAPTNEQDGWLTASEVYNLDLQQTNLVVLSACTTQLGELLGQGQGNVSAGDDVVGLTRAFLFAGTPSVMATLWNVKDQSTQLLMEHFYQNLQAGMSKAEALRQAQIALIRSEDYASPYYWAAFVLSGDGGPLPIQQPGWGWAWVGGLIVLIVTGLGAGGWWLHRRRQTRQTLPDSTQADPNHSANDVTTLSQ